MSIRAFRSTLKSPEPVLLDLVNRFNGGVDLVVVDLDGKEVSRGCIATITGEGQLVICNHLSLEVGVEIGELDTGTRIIRCGVNHISTRFA